MIFSIENWSKMAEFGHFNKKNSEVIPHLAGNKLRIIKIDNFLPRYDLVYRKLTKND